MFSLLLLIPFCLASHRSSKLEKWAFINDVILLEHRTGGFLHNCRIWNLYLTFYVIIYQKGVTLSYCELSVRRNSICNNDPSYPIRFDKNEENLVPNDRILRQETIRVWREHSRTKQGSESFNRDGAKLWIQAPKSIKDAKTLSIAKKAIKEYCSTLPI